MRTIACIAATFALVGTLGVAPARAAEPVEVTVPIEVDGGTTAKASPAVDCSGYAPATSTCMGTFTVTGDFGIRYGYQGGFYGYMYIRGETATYTIEIFCDVVMEGNAPSECDVTREGFLEVGQTFTLTGLVPGFGYWLIQAPV